MVTLPLLFFCILASTEAKYSTENPTLKWSTFIDCDSFFDCLLQIHDAFEFRFNIDILKIIDRFMGLVDVQHSLEMKLQEEKVNLRSIQLRRLTQKINLRKRIMKKEGDRGKESLERLKRRLTQLKRVK
nr:uncharacterized protein LOC121132162 [Lepeophtheirus salmonis]